jgi:hypothetical protein
MWFNGHLCLLNNLKTTIMKTIKNTVYLAIVCLSLVFIGCSKNNDDDGGGASGGGGDEFFTATIDGAGFAASTDIVSLIGGTVSTSNGMTVAVGQGSTNSGDFITFNIVGYTGPGTYTTGNTLTNPNMIQYGELNGTTPSVWGSNLATAVLGLSPGEIVITSDANAGLEGSFSFEGYNATDMSTKMITSGSFKLNLDN